MLLPVFVCLSVFITSDTSSDYQLSVYLDGQRLRHECHSTYLGVTLDRILCFTVSSTRHGPSQLSIALSAQTVHSMRYIQM